MGTDRGAVERPLDTKCPREHPATLGGTEAIEIEMQPRTTSRPPPLRVRDQNPFDRHRSQQPGDRTRGATAHTRADRFVLAESPIRPAPYGSHPSTSGQFEF